MTFRRLLSIALTAFALAVTSVGAQSTFRGALVTKNAGHQWVGHAVTTTVDWGNAVYDTDNIKVGNRLVVQPGMSKVRVMCSLVWNGGGLVQGTLRQVVVKKNGQFFPGDPVGNVPAVWGTTTDIQVSSPVLKVSPGDYFECEAYHLNGSAIELLQSTGTFFAMEVVQ